MALLIFCSRCGQQHLSGNPCRPEAIFNKGEAEKRDWIFDIERRIKKLEDEVEKLRTKCPTPQV